VCGGDLNFDGWRVGATVAGACSGAAAQIGVGDLHVTASGRLESLYGGNFGISQDGRAFSGFAGNGTISVIL